MGNLRRQSSKAEPVDEDTIEVKRESSPKTDLTDDLNASRVTDGNDEGTKSGSSSPSLSAVKMKTSPSSSRATSKSRTSSDAPSVDTPLDQINGHVSPKMESITPIKENRSASRKGIPRVAPLFDHLPDMTLDATSTYAPLEACTYANKYLGYTEHAMECDCSEEWDSVTKKNNACGEDSDCINRATKMECIGDCACGPACQNQRFQQKQYADVSVIKTEKKGYGLRTNSDLRAGDFIYEYIGEVINEGQFRRRMLQYDEEGIKHFYFMSLSRGEFVDATRKGNLGRFCNHSCNPNCYVDKWVVGDKLRMGIFAERKIRAGEELVFNYNVDRYGAKPQPCYCGESNCTGFIGGRTQTERATKLSAATIEALGIEDADSWDTVVARRPRKKKTGEDDEEYVDSVEAKTLDPDGVTKVMAALMQCKEKWIAAKLLQRIQNCDDEQVRNRVVRLHGYQILNSQLAAWKDDENIILQILDILDKFPRLTRNKIIDSKIESTLKPMTEHEDERVARRASTLLEEWSKLEVAYRIPRKKRDPNDTSTPIKAEQTRFERRESTHERKRSRSRSRSKSPPRGPSGAAAPSGPRSALPQRNSNYFGGPRPPSFNRSFGPLPRGWFQASDNGRTYYYSASGKTQWQRPTQPAEQPPPPPKQPSQQDVLKSIIDNIVEAKEKEKAAAKNSTPATPQDSRKEKKEKKAEKWRSYDEEKKKKLYENTLFPHISHVMNKYKSKIPREDLKRFAKEIAKKLVNSDFKNDRVKDPTKIDEKHQHKVKKFCKEYFDKAAHKYKRHEEEKAAKKAARAAKHKQSAVEPLLATPASQSPAPKTLEDSPQLEVKKEDETDEEDIKMSDDESSDEEAPSPSQSHKSLKRKRSSPDAGVNFKQEEEDGDDWTESPRKKPNLELQPEPETQQPQSPPPPPPPPAPPPEGHLGSPTDEVEMDLHADTSFKKKSMADVLAEAQQDNDDEAYAQMDIDGPPDPNTSMLATNGSFSDDDDDVGKVKGEEKEVKMPLTMENPLVDAQELISRREDEEV